MQLSLLSTDSLRFPPTSNALAEPDGLLAVGGDLSPERLIAAYRQGIFPWFEEGQPILWWSPDPRSVLHPSEVRVSRSLQRATRRFDLVADSAFAEVMDACAAPRGSDASTWITADMKAAYCHLHELGIAHSMEAWQDGQLVGGLYGIALGRVFFGESMFHRVSDASKVAFVGLAHRLQRAGFELIDCQVQTGHLDSLGAQQVPRVDFERRLGTLTNCLPLADPFSNTDPLTNSGPD